MSAPLSTPHIEVGQATCAGRKIWSCPKGSPQQYRLWSKPNTSHLYQSLASSVMCSSCVLWWCSMLSGQAQLLVV